MARDQERFSSACSVVVPAADVGFLPPLETDSPALDRYRRMLSPFLAPGAARELTAIIERAAIQALDPVLERGHGELVAEFANPVPARTTMVLLGLEPDDWWFFAQPLHDASYAVPGSPEFIDAIKRIAAFGGRIEQEVDARIAQPRDDMISRLLTDETDGAPATRDEVVGLARMVIFGGMDTVMAAMSHAVLRLGRDIGLQRLLRREPSSIPIAVEEILRLDAPIQGFARTTTRDCEVASHPLPAGELVFILWASANRDDQVFAEPEAFRLDRVPNRHLTFGIGPHFCQGAALARTEMRVMLEALLSRLPEFRVVEEDVVAPPTIGIANGFVAVPVVLDA